MGRMVVIGGGARSGKSRFALHHATRRGARRLFVATATVGDDEMRERVSRHREERGESFATVEAPVDIAGAIARAVDVDVIVVDCLTLWLSNLLLADRTDDEIDVEVVRLAEAVAECSVDVILVTNEVGLGIVPEHALGRRFRDIAGRTHQRLAAVADEVYLGAMGCILRLKPGPVVTMDGDA